MTRFVQPLIAVAALLSGCASAASVVSARSLCVDAFPQRSVSGWMPTTVDMLRKYQFGGPIPHVPLKDAFAGASETDRGAWCILRDGPDSSSLWGVVPGHSPQRALGVTGPGEGRYRGLIDRPPVVP